MTSMKLYQLFALALVVPFRSAVALPLSYASAVTYDVPLVVISISLFFLFVLFLAVKFVYMKLRRKVRPTRTTSGFRFQGKHGRGLLVGCLGSPTWETNSTSMLNGATCRRQQRRSSFAYQLHSSAHSASGRSKSRHSSSGSRFTGSTALASYSDHVDQLVLLSSSGSSRVTPRHGSSSSRVYRNASINCRPRYGDFGEIHGVRSPGGGIPSIPRRASPSSIRLVDGPSHSNQVEYSFLSVLPPDAVVRSPLTGTRDSFQISRCSLKCDRKPVPPLPSLPSFLPFYLPKVPKTMEPQSLPAREYLPPLRFSPLASVAKVFHSQQQVFEKKAPSGRATDYARVESAPLSKTRDASNAGSSTSPSLVQGIPTPQPVRKASTKSSHRRSPSCRGLAIGGSLPSTSLVTDKVATSPPADKRRCATSTRVLRTPSGSSHNGSVTSKKPLKSCLRQRSMSLACSLDSTLTPSMSEVSTQTHGTRRSAADQASIRTPISDNDIGMLGLDRFRWNDEIKELKMRSSHMKKDSIALVPLW